jgi:uncharacterized integral membrane protein
LLVIGGAVIAPEDSLTEDAAAREPREAIERALKSTGSRSFRVGLALGVIITVAVALLIVQNGESVQLNWLTFDVRAPLWILLMLTLFAGAIVWETTRALWRRGHRLRVNRRNALREVKSSDIGSEPH